MKNEPNAATKRNHWLSGMPVATPPAIARSRKPLATMARSTTGRCFREAE